MLLISINKASAQCITGDCKEGYSILKGKYTNGSSFIYEGNFKNSMFNGKGILKDEYNNTEYNGTFINNKFTCSNCSITYEIDKNNYYEYGKFVENILKEGVCEINFPEDKQKHFYTGSFANRELKNGTKKIIYDDGQIEIIEIVNFQETNTTSNILNTYSKKDIIGPSQQVIKLAKNKKKQLNLEIIFTDDIILSDCIFDTGAHGLSLNYKTYKALKEKNLAEKLNIDAVMFKGVGGTDESFMINIYKVKIGDFTLKNVIASVSIDGNKDFTLVGINFFDKFDNVIWNKKQNTLELFK